MRSPGVILDDKTVRVLTPVIKSVLWGRRVPADKIADLVQETFVALIGALVNFRGESGLSTFVAGVAKVVFLRWKERGNARSDQVVDLEQFDFVDERQASADARVEVMEAVQLLMKLPRAQRQAIVLYVFDDMTMQEIADLVGGVTATTIGGRLAMGRRRLSQLLAGERIRSVGI